jgi:hypothetical protein
MGEQAGILDRLVVDAAEVRLLGDLEFFGREGVQHAPVPRRARTPRAIRRLLGEALVVALLGCLLRLQVMEVSEELVEAMVGRQVRDARAGPEAFRVGRRPDWS